MRFNFEYFLFISIICSLFILLVRVMTPFTSKKYKRTWRYCIWVVLGIRLLIPADFSMSKSYINIDTIGKESSIENSNINFTKDNKVQKKDSGDKLTGVQYEDEKLSQNQNTNLENKAVFHESLIKILFYPWIIGVIVLTIYDLICYRKVKSRMKIMSKKLEHGAIRNQFENTKKSMKVFRNVEVRVCKCIQSPMVIGWCNPVLYLASQEYTEDELYYIFLHELIHVKKNHILIKFFFNMVNNIHWFNPFVYVMKKEVAKDIELLCDQEVVERINNEERKKYGEVILRCIDLRSNKEVLFSSSFSNSKKQIKERLVQVMNIKKKKKGIAFTGLILIGVTCCSLLVACNKDSTKDINSVDKKSQEEVETVKTGVSTEIITKNKESEVSKDNIDKNTAKTENQINIDETKIDKNGTFYLGMSEQELLKKTKELNIDTTKINYEITNSFDSQEFGDKVCGSEKIQFTCSIRDKNHSLYSISVQDDIPTKLGLKIGDTKDKMKQIYGSNYTSTKDDNDVISYKYKFADNYFIVRIEDNKVVDWSIIYDIYNQQNKK